MGLGLDLGDQRTHKRFADKLLVINKTFAHDREKIFADSTPWMYYKFDLSVSPLKPTDLQTQKRLASELLSVVQEHVEFAAPVAIF